MPTHRRTGLCGVRTPGYSSPARAWPGRHPHPCHGRDGERDGVGGGSSSRPTAVGFRGRKFQWKFFFVRGLQFCSALLPAPKLCIALLPACRIFFVRALFYSACWSTVYCLSRAKLTVFSARTIFSASVGYDLRRITYLTRGQDAVPHQG